MMSKVTKKHYGRLVLERAIAKANVGRLQTLSREAGVRWQSHQDLEQKLERIEQALNRCQNGTYGQCCSCHESIDRQRLAILPYAEFCLPCQRQREE